MIDPKLEQLLNSRPSVIRNSLLIRLVRFTSRLVGGCLLFIGILFMINAFTHGTLMDMSKDESAWIGLGILGAISVCASIPLFLVTRLCRMLLDRNAFIWELEMWREDFRAKEKKAAKEKA